MQRATNCSKADPRPFLISCPVAPSQVGITIFTTTPTPAFTMPRQSLSVVLAQRPTTDIVPGKTFHQKTEPAPTAADLKDGQILVETLYVSLDPAMRGWLNGKSPTRQTIR